MRYIRYIIRTSNHMLGRAMWDKLTGCVFESFEISRLKRGQFQSFQKVTKVVYPQNRRTNM